MLELMNLATQQEVIYTTFDHSVMTWLHVLTGLLVWLNACSCMFHMPSFIL